MVHDHIHAPAYQEDRCCARYSAAAAKRRSGRGRERSTGAPASNFLNSGITVSAARYLGYRRTDAARLSMLMSIPTILASGILLGAEVVGTADYTLLKNAAIGAVFAFVAALLALSLMMRLLKSVSFTPYVIYRVILGVILLWIAYS